MNLFASKPKECIFCNICRKKTDTEIIYEDDDYIVFPDIAPSSTHHYLVVTKKHIKDARCLTKSDIPLVKEMERIGKEVLQKQGGDISDIRAGFHWPPFYSIPHLHMHIISPVLAIRVRGNVSYRPNTPWFSTVETTLAWLEKKSKL